MTEWTITTSFVTAFLPRSKHLLTSWLQSLSAVILEAKKKKSIPSSSFSPSICHEVTETSAISFWMLSLKPAFSLFSFTLLKRLFNSSSRSAIRVVLSAYLRLLIFLLAILILACDSSSQAFHIMYSAYKLSQQGDNIQPWLYSFPNFEPVCFYMSGSNHCFFTCIHVSQERGRVFWYSHVC